MAFTFSDLNNTGWIVEDTSSEVIKKVQQNSAVERVAKRIAMDSNIVEVPRFSGSKPQLINKGEEYPRGTTNESTVQLKVHKFGLEYARAEEDISDSFVDVLRAQKEEYFSDWAVMYDNACLGVATAGNGTDARPFTSVYAATAANRKIQTAGPLKLGHLSDALGMVEDSKFYNPQDLVIIAPHQIRSAMRQLTDANGNLVLERGDALRGGAVDSMFGYDVEYSVGAKKTTSATHEPTGNSLVIVGPRSRLFNGINWEPSTKVYREERVDGVIQKMRVRRGFTVAVPEAFAIVEVTSA